MHRTPLILVASFGLLAGCATSSANSTPSNNPDAGKVNYDVGQPSGGGSGGSTTPSDGGSAGGDTTAPKGRDSTGTKAVGVAPKAVKKIASTKPPKPETAPVDPKKPVPPRKGRVEPNGLLGESFTLEASATKLPDFAAIGEPKAVFIAGNLDGTPATPLAGLPATAKAPIALRFTGSLNVTQGADYKLCTKSADGSRLLIEDTLVVEMDKVQADAAEACEVVNLEPGEYKLEVQSFHVSGPVLLQLSWAEGKAGTPAAVPKSNLFKPDGADDRVKAAAKK
jgi:hypothetical protein